jgi:hypothetical protein
VNTYDDLNVTLGHGFGAAGGLQQMLNALFARDAAARDAFLDAGVALDGAQWLLVDTERGGVEVGTNALRLLQVDPKLLSVFVTIAEDPQHAQANADTQFNELLKGGGKIPDYANEWKEWPTRLAMHLAHWLPAYSWKMNDYSQTNGELIEIVKRFGSLMVQRDSTQQANGALLVDGAKKTFGVVLHLKTLAKGEGFRALAGAAKLETISKEQRSSDAQWSGKLLFPAGGDSYYVIDP